MFAPPLGVEEDPVTGSLNADLAVIKWKKLRGYYRDLDRELHSSYTTDGNTLINKDRA